MDTVAAVAPLNLFRRRPILRGGCARARMKLAMSASSASADMLAKLLGITMA
jgi:hypothetical protein